jgi:phosphonate transport system substrate-binding protein
MRRPFPWGAVAAGALLTAAVTVWLYGRAVDLSRPYPAATELYEPQYAYADADTVFIGVISRYPSAVIYDGYQPIMDYLAAEMQRPFALMLSESYEETVRQLVEGRVAAAFLGSFLYVKAHEEHGIACVVQPVDEAGGTEFSSVLITRAGSDIASIEGLAGRRLALPNELSFSANWLPMHELGRAGLGLDDLAAVRHFPHHHAVVYEVLRGNFDAGVVKRRVATEFLDRGIRIVAVSDPIPGSPLVVPAHHDPVLTAAIADALLRLRPGDPQHAAMLASWDAEFAHGFGPARDADYDVIRRMMRREAP